MKDVKYPPLYIFVSILIFLLIGCHSKSNEYVDIERDIWDEFHNERLPQGESVIAFTDRIIIPHFIKERGSPLSVSSVPKFEILDYLAPSFRQKYTRVLKLDNQGRKQKLLDWFLEARDPEVHYPEKSSRIVRKTSQGWWEDITESGVSSYVRSILAVGLGFEARRGLVLGLQDKQAKIYLVPISGVDLREFTVVPVKETVPKTGVTIRDMSYSALCNRMEKLDDKRFFINLLNVFIEGFTEGIRKESSGQDLATYLDLAGVAMSEHYRRTVEITSEDRHVEPLDFLIVTLLDLYLSSNYQFGKSLLKKKTTACHYFSKSFIGKRKELHCLERQIEKDIKRRFPERYCNALKVFNVDCSNDLFSILRSSLMGADSLSSVSYQDIQNTISLLYEAGSERKLKGKSFCSVEFETAQL